MPWKAACALLMLAIWPAPAAMAQAAAEHAEHPAPLPVRTARAELRQTKAEAEKSAAETEKLKRDNGWPARLLSYLAPFLTALAAAAGVVVSVWTVGKNRRDADRREATQRREAREAAEVERFDERFAKAVSGLSSESSDEQCGAAVLVSSMVREKSEALSNQALQLLMVALQTTHDPVCDRLLRFALARFARAAPQRLVASEDGALTVGLVHVIAPQLNLANLELPGLDMAFANLDEADLRRAVLPGSKAYETRLENANLEGADLTRTHWARVHASGAKMRLATLRRAGLRSAELNGANFFRADLHRADLRYAELFGARFEKASLAGANFIGAQFDDRSLSSILRTDDWREARFDEEDRAFLEELDAE